MSGHYNEGVWLLIILQCLSLSCFPLLCDKLSDPPKKQRGEGFVWAHCLRVQSLMVVMEGIRYIWLPCIYGQEAEINDCYRSVLRALDNQRLSNVNVSNINASNESAQPLTPEPLWLKTGWDPTPAKFSFGVVHKTQSISY